MTTQHHQRLAAALALAALPAIRNVLPFVLAHEENDIRRAMLAPRRERDGWRTRRHGNGTPASKSRHAKNKNARKARRRNR